MLTLPTHATTTPSPQPTPPQPEAHSEAHQRRHSTAAPQEPPQQQLAAPPWQNLLPAWSDRQGAERLDWVGWAGCDRATNILAKG